MLFMNIEKEMGEGSVTRITIQVNVKTKSVKLSQSHLIMYFQKNMNKK